MRKPGRPIMPFVACSPEGETELIEYGVTKFAQEHGLTKESVYACIKGASVTHKGWRFRKPLYGEVEPKQDEQPIGPIRRGGGAGLEAVREEIKDAINSLSRKQAAIVAGEEQTPPNWKPAEALKIYEARAKMHGLELKHIVDARSDIEKFADAVEGLNALDDLWPELEGILDALETEYDKSIKFGIEYFQERNKAASEQQANHGPGGGGVDPKVWTETVLKWMDRLRKMKRVINRAKSDVDPKALESEKTVSEAVSLIRYMLFVMRSDFDTQLPGNIFMVGRHLVKMVVDIWEAENRYEWTPYGPRRYMEERDEGDWKGNRIAAGIEYDGAMLLYPPRHTKTSALRAWACRRMSRDQRTQGAYVHDMDDEASKFNRFVQSAFDLNTDTGKRNYSLYKFELADYDNDATTTRLQVDDPPKCPNLTCATVWSSKLGINLDWCLFDDVVPKKDQDQPTLRERRKQQIKRVWLTRFHGSHGFYIIAGYPWHHEDFVWDSYQEAKRWARSGGKAGQCLAVSKMPVGGPNTSPKFYSIWPEMYSPKELRRRYMSMNDASGWAANWMLNPITDDLRLVRRVRLYDETAPECKEGVDGGVMHVSLDPSSTNRVGSDKSGLVRAALGDVRVRTMTHWGEEVISETMLLVIDGEEFHATQEEAANRLGSIATSSRVDYIHVETAGGYGDSVRDLLRNIYGVASIISHKPGMRNKEQRLKGVAPLLEDGSAGLRAKVAFPARPDANGELVPCERVQKLIDYVVNFKVTTGHHSLDALTQLCKHVSNELGAGDGAVTNQILAAAEDRRTRLRKMFEEDMELEKLRSGLGGVLSFAEGVGV